MTNSSGGSGVERAGALESEMFLVESFLLLDIPAMYGDVM